MATFLGSNAGNRTAIYEISLVEMEAVYARADKFGRFSEGQCALGGLFEWLQSVDWEALADLLASNEAADD